MGLAYLSDGTAIDYKDYLQHPAWENVRVRRFGFDNGKCVICHKDLHGLTYQAHHMTYQRCGHENITDIVTLCMDCHDSFHRNWKQAEFWEGKELGHWDEFSLEHTARMCLAYWWEDRLICRDIDAPNMCHLPYLLSLIDRYFLEFNITNNPVMINPKDISLFVRNKRYELWFKAEAEGKTKEEFLDSYYGEKVRGQNPIRQLAGQFFNKHTDESYHRHYSENKDINLLMQRVKEMEDK